MMKNLHIYERARDYVIKLVGNEYIQKPKAERKAIFATVPPERFVELDKINCDGISAYIDQLFGWTGNSFTSGETPYIVAALEVFTGILANSYPGVDQDAERLYETYREHVNIGATVIKGGEV